ncbi:DUF3566 domain-containing protein [Parafrankia elaeagni]|uniref:DUF3566 domain-containing protein n=1 Tax=Parafrankia elaeagni TaxID=222534 RepID=UPI0003A55505|nr:DUF3566 domain-containing protein [Parafrankia elaeagni]
MAAKTPGGGPAVSGPAPAGRGGGTDRPAPTPRGSDTDRGGGARPAPTRTSARDTDPAPAGGAARKPADARRRTSVEPATATTTGQGGTRAGATDTTRKHDAQTTVTTPAARPGAPAPADRPRDTDTISLVRPNLSKRGTAAPTEPGAADVRNPTDRAAVTERMPVERRPTPEPVRAGAGPAATRAVPADRTAPYDRPGASPGAPPPSGGLGPNGLSTEPLGPTGAPGSARPGPLGPPGPQSGPRGAQRGGHDGFEPIRGDQGEQGQRRGPAGSRRARLRLSRVEPLSVTRLSFAFSLCVFLILIVAVAVLWFVLNSIGVFDSVTDAADTLTDGTNTDVSGWLSFGRAMQISLLVGAINVVLMTALATLGALLYNLCADMIGGLEVTLSDQ